MSRAEYGTYFEGEGARAYDEAQEEALADQVFGVPILLFNGEMFWGQDRLWLLKKRFDDAGLALSA
jgi:2-hydroxychromene-2-carboxylate isomerase